MLKTLNPMYFRSTLELRKCLALGYHLVAPVTYCMTEFGLTLLTWWTVHLQVIDNWTFYAHVKGTLMLYHQQLCCSFHTESQIKCNISKLSNNAILHFFNNHKLVRSFLLLELMKYFRHLIFSCSENLKPVILWRLQLLYRNTALLIGC